VLLGGATLDLFFDAQLRLDLGGHGEQVDGFDLVTVGHDFFDDLIDDRLGLDAAASTTGAHDALRAADAEVAPTGTASPAAMAASRTIFSSFVNWYGRMSPL